MTLADDLEARLKEGGWELQRAKKHGVWRHPVTLQTMVVPLSVRDTGYKRMNYLKTIEKKERIVPVEEISEPEEETVIVPPKSKPQFAVPKRQPASPLKPQIETTWFMRLSSTRTRQRMTRPALADALNKVPPLWRRWNTSMIKRLEFGQLILTEREFISWAAIMGLTDIEVADLLENMKMPFQDEGEPPITIFDTDEEPTVPVPTPTPAPEPTAIPKPARSAGQIDRQYYIDQIARVANSKRLTDAEVKNLYHTVSEIVLEILCTDPQE